VALVELHIHRRARNLDYMSDIFWHIFLAHC